MNTSNGNLGSREFLEEETGTFLSVVSYLRNLPDQKDAVSKCLLGIFWKVRGEEHILKKVIDEVGREISGYDLDPSRERNRIRKVFICALYKILVSDREDVYNYDAIISAYLKYAKDSGNWLGQPRIACCLSFLKEQYGFGNEALSYMKDEIGGWLKSGNDEAVALALLSIGDGLPEGDLRNILEHIKRRLNGNSIPLGLSATILIGLSRILGRDGLKSVIEDKIFLAIKEHLSKLLAGNESYRVDDVVLSALAIHLGKYHSISGYYGKYSADLKTTISKREEVRRNFGKIRSRNIWLYVLILACTWLLCLFFFLPSILEITDTKRSMAKLLIYLSAEKGWALGAAILITAYSTFSFVVRRDPIEGFISFLRERFPGFWKKERE